MVKLGCLLYQKGKQHSSEDDADEQSMINVKIPDGYEVVPLITGINETYQDCSFELGTGGPSATHSLSLSKQKVNSKSLVSTTVSVEDEVVHKAPKSILSGNINPLALQSGADPDELETPSGNTEVVENSVEVQDLFNGVSDHDDAADQVEEIDVPATSKEVETGEASHSNVSTCADATCVNQVVLEETCDEQSENDDVSVEVSIKSA
jgi:hypothetical protein